jgi:hypothetical protein
MTEPENLPKYTSYTEANTEAAVRGVIDPDLLKIPGPGGELLSNLFKGFENAYFNSGVDLSEERFLNQAVKALSNLWNGLTGVNEQYLEAIGSGKTLTGVNIPPISAPGFTMEVIQESLDIFLGLTYSYAVEIFAFLNSSGNEEEAEIFAGRFFDGTGVKLMPEVGGHLKKRAGDRIELLFSDLVRSERMIKGNDTNEDRAINHALIGDNIDEASIMPLVKEFFPEQEEKWKKIFDIFDGWAAGAMVGGLESRQFAWRQKWEEARVAVAGESDFSKMREIGNLPEFRPILQEMINIFKEPKEYDVVFVNDDGSEIPPAALTPADRATKKKKLLIPPATSPNALHVRHDYAKDGDPNSDQMANGAIDTQELIRQRHPDALPHVISVIWIIAISGELRVKYYSNYYSRYLKSPDPTFNADYPIITHAPMSRLLYAIRAYGKIPPNMRLLWQVLRLPKRTGDYQQLATRNNTRDRKNHPHPSLPLTPGSTIPPELDLVHPSYDGLEDEYNPIDTPINPATGQPDKENHPESAFNNNNVEEAIEVRTMQDYGLTLDDDSFVPVRLDDDLVLLPHYWDIIFPDPADPDYGKYKDITYKQYNAACTFHNEFLKKAQFPGEMHSVHDVKNIIGGLIRMISPFKGLFALMPAGTGNPAKDTIRGARHRRFLQEVMLRVTKNVYDQFMEKVKWQFKPGKRLTKHGVFIEEAASEYEKMGTLIPEIQNYLMHKIEADDGLGYAAKLLSTTKGSPLDLTNLGFSYRERNRREELIDQYLSEEPPPDEKK